MADALSGRLEKIKTIGDAYMVVAGLPKPRPDHAAAMAEMALDMLSRRDIVTLDNERKAAMVSNLLVVLCSDHDATPVVNTGTLYQ